MYSLNINFMGENKISTERVVISKSTKITALVLLIRMALKVCNSFWRLGLVPKNNYLCFDLFIYPLMPKSISNIPLSWFPNSFNHPVTVLKNDFSLNLTRSGLDAWLLCYPRPCHSVPLSMYDINHKLYWKFVSTSLV